MKFVLEKFFWALSIYICSRIIYWVLQRFLLHCKDWDCKSNRMPIVIRKRYFSHFSSTWKEYFLDLNSNLQQIYRWLGKKLNILMYPKLFYISICWWIELANKSLFAFVNFLDKDRYVVSIKHDILLIWIKWPNRWI